MTVRDPARPRRRCDFRIHRGRAQCSRWAVDPGPNLPAACWQHDRMYDFADLVVAALFERYGRRER